MAQTSYPDPAYNSGALTEAEWERVAVRAVEDGVYGDPNDPAVVIAATGLNVTVKAERSGHVRGHNWYSGATDYTHAIASNSSGQTRVDRIVLQLDRTTWQVRSIRKAGTPGSGAPSLQQDTGSTDLYEIPLAKVTVANNASSVTVQREELWVGSRCRPCTSSTRPLAPKRGELVWETDTGRLMLWTGTAWVVVYEDSGEVTLNTGSSLWQHYIANRASLRNGVVHLRLGIKWTGTNPFAVSDADGSHIGSLPSVSMRPVGLTHVATGLFSNGALGRVEVRSDGQIWVREHTKDVTTNITMVLTMSYPIGA